jgi:hypothetical protein
MDKEKFLNSGLMELYVLGLASPAEQEIVMEFALTYPDIQETLDLSVDALEEYAKANAIMPPKDLRKKILNELEEAEEVKQKMSLASEKNVARKSRFLVPLLSIGILILGILAFILFQKNQAGAQQYQELQEEYAIFKAACEEKNGLGQNSNGN